MRNRPADYEAMMRLARRPKLTPEALAAKLARERRAGVTPGGRVSRQRSRSGARRAAIREAV